MMEMMGIRADEWQGDLPESVEDAATPVAAAAPAEESPEVARLRDPAVQFKFIHEEAKDGGDPALIGLEMLSEVFWIEWSDASGHTFRQDVAPEICPECRASKFTEKQNLREITLRLPLKFSQIEVHRKKVWELIENFALVVRAEMMAGNVEPTMSARWMNDNRGRVEVGVTSVPAKQKLHEIFLRLSLGTPEEVDGIVDSAMTVAGITLLGMRNQRALDFAKKVGSPTTASQPNASGSAGSISGS